jgi:hypothetical protein
VSRIGHRRLLQVAALATIGLLALYFVSHALAPTLDTDGRLAKLFFKDAVSIGRLLASASIFPLVFALMTVLGARKRAQAALAYVLVPFGRHSLLAFVLHLVALVGIAVAGAALSFTPFTSAMLQLLTLGFVWVSIRLCTHAAELQRPQPSRRRLALVWNITAALIRG